LILIFVVFYFLLIMPQQKKAKQHKEMLANIDKGDDVVTSGGIHGKVVGVADNVLTLEVADKVKIKVSREFIAYKKSATEEKKG
jgi:preprotein translocase subunit YajC